MPILTQKSLVLAAVETTQGVDVVPTATANAFLCENPVFTIQSVNLERNFARPDFSTYASRIGRKLAQVTFAIQLSGSGTAAMDPTWAVLFQGCAMARTAVAAPPGATTVSAPSTLTTGGTLAAGTYYYKVSALTASGETLPSNEVSQVTTGATSTVTLSWTAVTGATGYKVYRGTAAGAETVFYQLGVVTTYTDTGAAVTGNGSPVTLAGAHINYTPITTGQQTLTIYVYYEGLLHRMTGCMGNFSIQADAGQYGMVNFTFTGLYNTPQNAGYPGTVTQQNVVPPQCELAQLSYNNDNTIIVKSFKADLANKVVARPDLNSANGFKAVRISGRQPTGGFDPEVETTHTFWSQLESSTLSAFHANIGTVAGNEIQIDIPQAQIIGIQYGDRDNLRVWDLSLELRRNAGNDEITISFW